MNEEQGIIAGLQDVAAGRTKPFAQVKRELKEEWLWTVARFYDRICKRKAKIVRKEEEFREKSGFGKVPDHIFESEQAAVSFMVQRAEEQVKKHEAEVCSAKKRLAKLKKKLASVEGDAK